MWPLKPKVAQVAPLPLTAVVAPPGSVIVLQSKVRLTDEQTQKLQAHAASFGEKGVRIVVLEGPQWTAQVTGVAL